MTSLLFWTSLSSLPHETISSPTLSFHHSRRTRIWDQFDSISEAREWNKYRRTSRSPPTKKTEKKDNNCSPPPSWKVYPPQQGLFFSLSLCAPCLSTWKVIKKYKHTCRHAIREKLVSPKEAVCEIFLNSPKSGILSSVCEQKRLFSLSLWIPRKHGFSTRNNHFKLIREEEATTTHERNEPYSEHISNSKW